MGRSQKVHPEVCDTQKIILGGALPPESHMKGAVEIQQTHPGVQAGAELVELFMGINPAGQCPAALSSLASLFAGGIWQYLASPACQLPGEWWCSGPYHWAMK